MDVSSDQCVVESDDAAATRPVETSGQAAGADPGQADSAPVQSHLVSQPLEEMAQSLATVTALVTDTQRHARSREAVIDKLHQESQEVERAAAEPQGPIVPQQHPMGDKQPERPKNEAPVSHGSQDRTRRTWRAA